MRYISSNSDTLMGIPISLQERRCAASTTEICTRSRFTRKYPAILNRIGNGEHCSQQDPEYPSLVKLPFRYTHPHMDTVRLVPDTRGSPTEFHTGGVVRNYPFLTTARVSREKRGERARGGGGGKGASIFCLP